MEVLNIIQNEFINTSIYEYKFINTKTVIIKDKNDMIVDTISISNDKFTLKNGKDFYDINLVIEDIYNRNLSFKRYNRLKKLE